MHACDFFKTYIFLKDLQFILQTHQCNTHTTFFNALLIKQSRNVNFPKLDITFGYYYNYTCMLVYAWIQTQHSSFKPEIKFPPGKNLKLF